MRFNGSGEAFSRSPELFCWWLPAAFPRLCLAPRQKYGCCRDHVGRGSANGSRGLPGRAANGGRGSAVDVRQLLRHAAVRQLLSRTAQHCTRPPRHRARPRHRLAAVSGRAAGAARPGRGSVSRTPSRCPECRQVPASTSHQFTAVSRQSQSPCCQQPSPSERFILTQGNARLNLATPGKLCCLAVAGVWPATAIFSLVPRLPYWPQRELLCWHGLCPWSKLLTHSFISTDMHFSYLTILLSCESPQHISGR